MRWCEVGGSVAGFVEMDVAVATGKNPTVGERRMGHGLCGGEEVCVVCVGVGWSRVEDEVYGNSEEAMMRRGVFPLPCHSTAAGGWQGTGHEFCVVGRRRGYGFCLAWGVERLRILRGGDVTNFTGDVVERGGCSGLL